MVEIVRISACIFVVLEHSRIVFCYNCDFGSFSDFNNWAGNRSRVWVPSYPQLWPPPVADPFLASKSVFPSTITHYEHSRRGLMAFLCRHVQCRLPTFVRGLDIYIAFGNYHVHRGLGRRVQCRHSVHDLDLDIDSAFDTEHFHRGIVAVPTLWVHCCPSAAGLGRKETGCLTMTGSVGPEDTL